MAQLLAVRTLHIWVRDALFDLYEGYVPSALGNKDLALVVTSLETNIASVT